MYCCINAQQRNGIVTSVGHTGCAAFKIDCYSAGQFVVTINFHCDSSEDLCIEKINEIVALVRDTRPPITHVKTIALAVWRFDYEYGKHGKSLTYLHNCLQAGDADGLGRVQLISHRRYVTVNQASVNRPMSIDMTGTIDEMIGLYEHRYDLCPLYPRHVAKIMELQELLIRLNSEKPAQERGSGFEEPESISVGQLCEWTDDQRAMYLSWLEERVMTRETLAEKCVIS